MLSQSLRKVINDLWAKYHMFRVGFVIVFLVFITGVSVYVVYTLYQVGFIHYVSLVFILLLFGVQRGVFMRIVNMLKKK